MSVSNVIKGVYSARTHVRVCAVFGREYGVKSHTVHLPHDLMSGWAFAFGLLSTLDRCIAKKKMGVSVRKKKFLSSDLHIQSPPKGSNRRSHKHKPSL